MKATEIKQKIDSISRQLHELSNALVQDIEYDGMSAEYLASKVKCDLVNIANHVEGQVKHLAKFERKR